MRKVLLTVIGIILATGIAIILYLFSDREWFPLTSYAVDVDSVVSNTYKPSQRPAHIGHQDTRASPDGNLHYIDQGSGAVILLIHGTPTSSWMYRKLISVLTDAGYRVIAPDMLGYGSSDKPIGRDLYTEKKQADRIVGLMDYLEVDSRHHVAHDIGGLWTWEVLMDNANRIDSLILLNTIIDSQGFHPPGMMKSRPRIGDAFTKLITIDPLSRLIMSQTLSMMVVDQNAVNTAMIDGYLYPTMQGQRRIYGYFLSSLGDIDHKLTNYHGWRKDNEDKLPPLRVIRGSQDVNLDASQIETLQRYRDIDQNDITIWQDVGHLVTEERPEQVADIIKMFIGAHNTGTNK